MKEAIQCKYSCFTCGVHRQVVTIPAREDEDVTQRMDNIVIVAMAADHQRRSPGCRSTKLDEVMIPISDTEGNQAEKIGGLPRRNPLPDKKKT